LSTPGLETSSDPATSRGVGAVPSPDSPRILTFAVLWVGQFVSLVGSGLTGFALGVWIYQRTGVVTDYAMICFFSVLPGIVLAPMAGVIADRWDRRRAMILADLGSGVCMLTVAALLLTKQLGVWHIWVTMGANSVFRALQLPAYSATVTLLVPKEHFGRANGAVQTALALAHILAPVMAGMLMAVVAVHVIVLLDVASFLFAVLTLLMIRFPQVPISAEGRAARGTFLTEATFGLRYIRSHPGLPALLVTFAGINFSFGMAFALVTPLVLSTRSAQALGTLVSVGGVGMLSGGIIMSIWGGPRRRVHGLLAAAAALGVALTVLGLASHTVALGAALFAGLLSIPIAAACFQAIWQRKVPADLQGRVFAVRNMLTDLTVPLAFLIAGPLADRLSPSGAGGGGGRGASLLLCGVGVLLTASAILGRFARTLNRVEDASAHPEPRPAHAPLASAPSDQQ
jgi:DHA3 family macrolide efflux protein-like MFS transporter